MSQARLLLSRSSLFSSAVLRDHPAVPASLPTGVVRSPTFARCVCDSHSSAARACRCGQRFAGHTPPHVRRIFEFDLAYCIRTRVDSCVAIASCREVGGRQTRSDRSEGLAWARLHTKGRARNTVCALAASESLPAIRWWRLMSSCLRAVERGLRI